MAQEPIITRKRDNHSTHIPFHDRNDALSYRTHQYLRSMFPHIVLQTDTIRRWFAYPSDISRSTLNILVKMGTYHTDIELIQWAYAHGARIWYEPMRHAYKSKNILVLQELLRQGQRLFDMPDFSWDFEDSKIKND